MKLPWAWRVRRMFIRAILLVIIWYCRWAYPDDMTQAEAVELDFYQALVLESYRAPDAATEQELLNLGWAFIGTSPAGRAGFEPARD